MNKAQNKNSRSTFTTTEFEWAHGRRPRGRGSWAFRPYDDRDFDSFVFSPSMTYSEAKKWVVREHGHGDWVVGS